MQKRKLRVNKGKSKVMRCGNLGEIHRSESIEMVWACGKNG